jgi:hypothetical protein
VKRLRARFPKLQIILGLWGMAAADAADVRRGTRLGGADQLVITLAEACARLQSLWPLHRAASTPAPGGVAATASTERV